MFFLNLIYFGAQALACSCVKKCRLKPAPQNADTHDNNDVLSKTYQYILGAIQRFTKFIKIGFFSLFFINQVNALESINIDVESIKAKDWQLNEISLSLFDLQQTSQQLRSSIKEIILPAPLSNLKLLDIHCNNFTWQQNLIICQTGKAKLNFKTFHSKTFDFSFSIADQNSKFSIDNFKLEKGKLSLVAEEIKGRWTVSIKTQNLSLKTINTYLPKQQQVFDEISQGNINVNIKINGDQNGAVDFLIKSIFTDLTLQANQGKIATEGVNLEWELQAKLQKGKWYWNNNAHIKQGELYIEPVYLEIKDNVLSLSANGNTINNNQLLIQYFNITHSNVISIKADGLVNYRPNFSIKHAHIKSEIINLDQFSNAYVAPFIEETAIEGFKLFGNVNIESHIVKSTVTDVSLEIKSLKVLDEKQRIEIQNTQGIINWSNDPLFETASEISWDQLKIRAIPIDASHLRFLLKNKQLTLLEKSTIPLLRGSVYINKFNWQHTAEGEPHIYFQGGVEKISLEKLSYALDWTPLSGSISGYIPGVNFKNKTLTLKGELQAQLFDGTIKINNLSSSGLFTDFSKFSMDMLIENLDLYAITQKFKMGRMEGRISGFVNQLYLENWEPVSFYAWIGTPENDNSRHRISQKAVQNIASIGGGGAADIISKGFLRFFDTFHYDRLGFGCYLHQGVCQLMGIEAAEQGYYLVKGGGLPRIDIKGYNTELDWNELMQRLSRITSIEEVVIE